MNLHIAATDRTPEVLLTENPLHFKLMGESFPEDVSVFYGPVITSINNLSLAPQGSLRVEMELSYINSSSIKAMYRIFEGIESYRKTGSVVNVVWKSDKDDDIMQELGEDFKDVRNCCLPKGSRSLTVAIPY